MNLEQFLTFLQNNQTALDGRLKIDGTAVNSSKLDGKSASQVKDESQAQTAGSSAQYDQVAQAKTLAELYGFMKTDLSTKADSTALNAVQSILSEVGVAAMPVQAILSGTVNASSLFSMPPEDGILIIRFAGTPNQSGVLGNITNNLGVAIDTVSNGAATTIAVDASQEVGIMDTLYLDIKDGAVEAATFVNLPEIAALFNAFLADAKGQFGQAGDEQKLATIASIETYVGQQVAAGNFLKLTGETLQDVEGAVSFSKDKELFPGGPTTTENTKIDGLGVEITVNGSAEKTELGSASAKFSNGGESLTVLHDKIISNDGSSNAVFSHNQFYGVYGMFLKADGTPMSKSEIDAKNAAINTAVAATE